jgi:hypothetical protein
VKRFKSHHWFGYFFDKSMVLFDNIIQIFNLAYLDHSGKSVKANSQKRETNRSWRTDETYIKVKGEWGYLYRAVDSHCDTLDFRLSTDNPTIERSMININPSFFHNFFKVAIRNALPDIKENRIKNNVLGKMSPFKTEHNLILGYLYRAVDSHGDTLDFMLSERRDEEAATAFFKQAINNNGFPDKVVMDKSGANINCL